MPEEYLKIKQGKLKEAILEHLKKIPIAQIACERAGVSRATYYRWRAKSPKFAAECDKAITDGSYLVNDMAESQLISAIKDKNLTAIMFWLKHRSPSYGNKLEVSASIKAEQPLTKEQEAAVRKALRLASLLNKK